MDSPFTVDGKTVLVTGAASGIGKATAELCATLGAKLILVDLNEAGLRQTIDSIGKDDTVSYALDLTN